MHILQEDSEGRCMTSLLKSSGATSDPGWSKGSIKKSKRNSSELMPDKKARHTCNINLCC